LSSRSKISWSWVSKIYSLLAKSYVVPARCYSQWNDKKNRYVFSWSIF
jgi:hypothetical protein